MNAEALITPEQTSNLLGVSTHTLAVWRCRKRYGLRYVKLGRKVMYRPTDIERFLRSRTEGGCANA